jgi:hypothetical protein
MSNKKDSNESSVRWDDANIRSSYANVCNVISSREEVGMLFGMNQKWDNETNELVIELSERIVLTPYAAKRVAALLKNVIEQYEAKFGPIHLDAEEAAAAGGKKN